MIYSKTPQKETQYRIDNGLLFHILITGYPLGENSRANQYHVRDQWKEYLKQMLEILRDEGHEDEARDLKMGVDFYTHAQNNRMYVTVAPDVWHIFTYALRKLPNGSTLYTRIICMSHREGRGWM